MHKWILLEAGFALQNMLGLEIALVVRTRGKEGLPTWIEGAKVKNSRSRIGRVNTGDLIVTSATIDSIPGIGQNLPGEFDICRGERFAIRPFQVWL